MLRDVLYRSWLTRLASDINKYLDLKLREIYI
jgi:hypothetical protein